MLTQITYLLDLTHGKILTFQYKEVKISNLNEINIFGLLFTYSDNLNIY